jgi:hypothetical protein
MKKENIDRDIGPDADNLFNDPHLVEYSGTDLEFKSFITEKEAEDF